MKLYAVVIGRRPKHNPFIAYKSPSTDLAIFEKREKAVEFINQQSSSENIKNWRVVLFRERQER